MKIGILTFHDGINYGAFFQVSALQRFLTQNQHDCQVINYKDKGFANRELRGLLNVRHPLRTARNVRKMRKFKQAHAGLNLTPRIRHKDELARFRFDRIVIGSDEVWNYATRYIGYDPTYFSAGLNADKIVSYAASFGNISPEHNTPAELVKLLAGLSAISVRDQNSIEVLGAMGLTSATRVLDPVFLADFAADAIHPRERDYLLVYGYAFSEEMKREILNYAAEKGLRTLSAGYRHDWCDKSLDMLGPFEWLGYLLDSTCVVTTMFHGFLLSLINNKNFCMFTTPYRANKLGTLPTELGVGHRVVGEGESVSSAFMTPIDFEHVNALTAPRREASINYLLNALT